MIGASPQSCSQCIVAAGFAVRVRQVIRTDAGELYIDGKRIGLLATISEAIDRAESMHPGTVAKDRSRVTRKMGRKSARDRREHDDAE